VHFLFFFVQQEIDKELASTHLSNSLDSTYKSPRSAGGEVGLGKRESYATRSAKKVAMKLHEKHHRYIRRS
jgi:hypothetical protein